MNSTVMNPLHFNTQPGITGSSEHIYVKEGKSTVLSCTAIGGASTNVTWFLSGSPFNGPMKTVNSKFKIVTENCKYNEGKKTINVMKDYRNGKI